MQSFDPFEGEYYANLYIRPDLNGYIIIVAVLFIMYIYNLCMRIYICII